MLECDSDGDGVLDATEIADGTDPFDQCSLVMASQTLPPTTTWNNADCDADGVNNETEIADVTNPFEPCSLIVASQTLPIGTAAWNDLDCDNDGVFNGYETGNVSWSTSDTDSDGIPDYLDPDDDNDGIITVNENPDSNNDGNPNDAFDSDGDSIPDYLEPNNDSDSEDGLDIFGMVTPNDDGENDILVIKNVESYPDNALEIFNRWGVQVYEVQGYGQNGKYFKGVSEGRVTLNQGSELPVGTYFYLFKYKNTAGVVKNRSGYLQINR
jgi:gliding motility-associated-like protein